MKGEPNLQVLFENNEIFKKQQVFSTESKGQHEHLKQTEIICIK